MYFLLSTLQSYLPLLREDYPYVYELRDIVVISNDIYWTFFGACAPRLTDNRHIVDAYV